MSDDVEEGFYDNNGNKIDKVKCLNDGIETLTKNFEIPSSIEEIVIGMKSEAKIRKKTASQLLLSRKKTPPYSEKSWKPHVHLS
jgi:hypothetical protein